MFISSAVKAIRKSIHIDHCHHHHQGKIGKAIHCGHNFDLKHLFCCANSVSKHAHNCHQPSVEGVKGSQENGKQLQARANRALANNAGTKEWQSIKQEAQDRKDQIELNRGDLRILKSGELSNPEEMKLLDKIIKLADKKINEKAGGTTPPSTTPPKNEQNVVEKTLAREVLDNINPDFRDSKVDDYLRKHINRNPNILKYATTEEKAHILKCVIDGRADSGDSKVMLNVLKSIKSPEELNKVLNGAGFHGKSGADWLNSKLSSSEKRDMVNQWKSMGDVGQQMIATWIKATSQVEG